MRRATDDPASPKAMVRDKSWDSERMQFAELRQTGLPIGEENDRADRLFPLLIGQSHLHIWRPGDSISCGRRLLVGIVKWSLYDLSLLDVLEQSLSKQQSRLGQIDVFDLDQVGQSDLDSYIQNMGRVVVTPVAGIWKDGVLYETGFGWRVPPLISGLLDVKLEWNHSEWRWDVQRGR
jgi:hypothetical protein